MEEEVRPQAGTIEAKDSFAMAPPGHSLTIDNERWPWGKPQEQGFSPDVGLLIKGPLALYIASVAEDENIPYRMFENENALTQGEMDDKTFFRMMRQNNPAMFAYVSETINEGIRQGRTPQPPEEKNFMTMKKKES